MPKVVKFYRKPKNLILAGAAATILIFVLFLNGKETVVDVSAVIAKRGPMVQEISVTGTVKPAESVNLSFEISGKVSEIFADVGSHVEAGQKLISLANADLAAQLRQAQAGVGAAQARLEQYAGALEAEKAILDQYKKGTRQEEITIAKTNVENAENEETDAERTLEDSIKKAEADLNNTYSATLNKLPAAVNSGKFALTTLSDIQYKYFRNSDFESSNIEQLKEQAVYELLGAANAGEWTSESISKLSGGVYGEIQSLSAAASHEEIDSTLAKTISALQKVKYALDSVPLSSNLSSTDITNLETEKTNINSKVSDLSGQQQSVNLQKVSSENAINVAEAALNSAKNALISAQDQLDLKRAGYTAEQIRTQEAQLKQAQANYNSQLATVAQAYANAQNSQAQLDKTALYAPISGLVTKMAAKVGEIVFPSSPYSDSRVTFVSIISDKNFEIEAYIAEVDIAKVKFGDKSRVTLDAYGNDMEFEAAVTEIDPAETIIDGIPTYKITLQFVGESEAIKSGMTANLDIVTDKLDDVIGVPNRAVITQSDGKKIVKILRNVEHDGKIAEEMVEVEVKTGIRGSDGRIEITEGVKEGEKVVVSTSE